MGDRFLSVAPSDRALEQAMVGLKKGAYILKYGRRGKPKLCPFRLSTDERTLMWFSGNEEKQLQLSSVTSIVRGHGTRKLQPERECHAFSLVYMNNQAQYSLDLVCKDKMQADSWFLGLKTLISRSRGFGDAGNIRGAQSCVCSPASIIPRKYNLGLSKETTKMSQVRSVCGSPIPSSFSYDGFYSRLSSSSVQNLADGLVLSSPGIKPEELKKNHKILSRFVAPSIELPLKPKKTKMSDVLIWGEGVENGVLGGGIEDRINGHRNRTQADALLPKVVDSVSTLDVETISLAGKNAVLVTKHGEVFCWGEGNPKEVESLGGVRVKSVSCSEYQTCAASDSGELYTWGDNGRWRPHHVYGGLDGICVSKVACGEWHTAIVSTSGELFTFGDGTFGVLGHGNCQSLKEPKQVESLKGLRVKSVSCGPWHTAAVVGITTRPYKSSTDAGKLFTWGDGDKGRLGHRDHETRLVPTCVMQLVDQEFVQVSCGRMLTVGLTSTGVVYTIGSSVHGQLGNPHASDESVTLVQGKLKLEFVREIASGSYHVAVLTSKGNVYTWGKGANGQLGLGDTEDRSSPTFVESLRHRQVQSISCGSSLTAAICIHKPITCGRDQSACRGCNIEFGFMKKKHNCYNCGLLFCSLCSSKKTKNACLAPDEGRYFRVCDSCYKVVEPIRLNAGQMVKMEDVTPRPLLTKTFCEEPDDATPKPRGIREIELESCSSVMPRWGQVSSPASFRKHCKEGSCISEKQQRDVIKPSVKHKGGRDVLKALTSRLQSMSPRAFMRKQVKTKEWVEEYEAGVHITFIMLPSGQKGIKRVRFSRKVFREREAERWWEDNQHKVYQNYNLDGYMNSY